MKTKFLSMFVAMVLGLSLSNCANYYYERANEDYNTWNYSGAIKHYQKAMEKKSFSGATEKLAFAFQQINNLEDAALNYELALNAGELSPKGYFNYATVLMQSGRYKKAVLMLNKFLLLHPNDPIAMMMIESCNSIDNRYKDTTLYSLQKISTPSLKSVFGAVPFHSGIIVVADKEATTSKKANPWNGATFLDFYFIQKNNQGSWGSPEMMSNLDGPYHEGPATFTADQNRIFFTRSSYGKKGLNKNCNHVSTLKIFTAEMRNGMWTTPVLLPFNSDDFSCGHPTLSADGKTMYFISDMPGGFGGTDLYKIELTDGEWSKPINLGKTINTPGNEMFPYIHNDGTLYFSSDAHNSMGGLDIFKSKFNGKNWSQPENMDAPVNSTADDFSFLLMDDNKTGFLSSSRDGKDELYTFTKNPPTFILFGTLKKKGTSDPVDNATITLTAETTGEIIQIKSDEDGKFQVRLTQEEFYNMNSSKQGFFTIKDQYSTREKIYSENIYVDYEMEEIIEDKAIVLENIYYEYNKWDILPTAAEELDKLVNLLMENPTIEIELSSHTDNRGSDKYNEELSQKRAKAAVDYIISKGISETRITAVGYGESKPVVDCQKNCSEEDFQRNRRTEFKITKK